MIYHMEQWEEQHEAWQLSSRSSRSSRPSPGRLLTLQNKTAGLKKTPPPPPPQLGPADAFQRLLRYNHTAADKAADRSSLLRAYSRRLYLLVQRDDASWSFPSTLLSPDDSSLRLAAERAAAHALAPFDVYMFGNAPVGHIGQDHFFFMGEIVWLSGQRIPDVSKITQKSPSVWVTRDEMADYLQGAELECADKMLAKI